MNTWRVLRWHFTLPELALVGVMALAYLCIGCGSSMYSAGQHAAQGVLDAMTPTDMAKVNQEAQRLATTTVTAARDVVLDQGTQVRLDRMVAALGVDVRAQVAALLAGIDLRPIVRAALEEVQRDLPGLIDAQGPHLASVVTQAVGPLNTQVASLEGVVDRLAIALGCSAVVAAGLLALIVLEVRKHRTALERLLP